MRAGSVTREKRLSPSTGWAFGAFIALTLISAWPLLRQFGSALPSDLGDLALNTWILWWNAKALPLTTAWWNAPMFSPAPNAFAQSESLLALTPLTTPLLKAGVSPIATYNVVFLLAGPLSALGAYLLAWRLTSRRSAALIAALAFGFSPYRIAQLPHLQMEWACWLPLALYCLHAFVDSARPRWLVGFGLCWLMTGLTNGYFLIFFPVLLALWVIWFVRERRDLIGIVATFVASSLPLLPLLLSYRARQQAFGLARGIGEIQDFSADVSALWAASPQAWLSSLWTLRPRPEGELYPGIAIAALALCGIILLIKTARANASATAPRHRARSWLIGIAAVSFALSMAVALTGGWDVTIGPLVWTAHKVSRSLTVTFWALIGAASTTPALRGAWRRRSPLAFYLLGSGVMFVMALGPSARVFGQTIIYKAPYSWLMLLPGGDSVRVPARFGELMILCLCVAGAIAWARLAKPGHHLATGLVAAAVLCEGWIVLPVSSVPPSLDVPAIAAGIPILELPMRIDYPAQTRALLHSISHGHPIVNGFSGYDPPHFAALRLGLIAGDASVIDALKAPGPLAVFVDRATDTDEVEVHRMRQVPDATAVTTTAQGTWFTFPRREPLPQSSDERVQGVSATSATNPSAIGAMFDASIRTRWHTIEPQQAGTSIALHVDHQATITALELRLGAWVGDFPLALEVSTPDGTTGSRVVWRGSTYGLTVRGALSEPKETPIVIRFDSPVVARALTLVVTATDPKRVWSVAELRVLGR